MLINNFTNNVTIMLYYYVLLCIMLPTNDTKFQVVMLFLSFFNVNNKIFQIFPPMKSQSVLNGVFSTSDKPCLKATMFQCVVL